MLGQCGFCSVWLDMNIDDLLPSQLGPGYGAWYSDDEPAHRSRLSWKPQWSQLPKALERVLDEASRDTVACQRSPTSGPHYVPETVLAVVAQHWTAAVLRHPDAPLEEMLRRLHRDSRVRYQWHQPARATFRLAPIDSAARDPVAVLTQWCADFLDACRGFVAAEVGSQVARACTSREGYDLLRRILWELEQPAGTRLTRRCRVNALRQLAQWFRPEWLSDPDFRRCCQHVWDRVLAQTGSALPQLPAPPPEGDIPPPPLLGLGPHEAWLFARKRQQYYLGEPHVLVGPGLLLNDIAWKKERDLPVAKARLSHAVEILPHHRKEN